MPQFYLARRQSRQGALVPIYDQNGTLLKQIIIPGIQKISDSQLDELVHATCERLGVKNRHSVAEQAEKESEHRREMQEAHVKLKELMKARANGQKLIQVGYRKWQPAFYLGGK